MTLPKACLPVLAACCAAALSAQAPAPFSEAPLPQYPIRRATGPVEIDGSLADFSWAAAPQIDAFTRILSDYGQVLHPTRARMLWDDEHLYIAFACRDDDIWALFTQEDDPMWSEEVVEAFIDPDGNGRHYLEVEVNPLNAVVDLHIDQVHPEWKADRDWDIAGLRTAVEVHGTVNDNTDADEGWTMEMAIPWSAFDPAIRGGGRPQVGDRWRLNLYRIERRAGALVRARLVKLAEARQRLSEQLEGLGDDADEALVHQLEDELAALEAETSSLSERYNEQTEHTAWSPTFQRGFHHPQRFGIVEFSP